MSSRVIKSTRLWGSLYMVSMQMVILFSKALRVGVISPLLLKVIPKYLNSLTDSYGLNWFLFFGGWPLCYSICIFLVFFTLIVILMLFVFLENSVRVLTNSEAGMKNDMSTVYGLMFSVPNLSSSYISRGPKHRLMIHREMMLPCGVPLLVFNLFSSLLM